ncbi:MAG: fibronectin type III domain-containing protein [Deltaproteobacteria bacterium]|nr:fibronectin type III domain-containing protein [Deltaproteobacteria bacterium]
MDITLQWNASVGSSGYRVYYTTGCPGPPYDGTEAVEGSSPIDVGNVTQFTLHDIPDGDCRFALTAYNAYGESGYSAEITTAPAPPFIYQYPFIYYSANAIYVTYNEPNLQNATIEGNYRFNPSLNFATSGDDITAISANTCRLAMASIPNYMILTMTVTDITDAACYAVTPSSIKINDNDDDGMADDWERYQGVDNPNNDPDDDGLTNLLEFQYSTDPFNPDTDGDGTPDKWDDGVPCHGDLNTDGDVDGSDLAEVVANSDPCGLSYFAAEFGITNLD